MAGDLLHGLADLGHRIDCFFPIAGHELPPGLAERENVTMTWGSSAWRWDRWYSRSNLGAFTSGLFARGRAAMGLRKELVRRHRQEPYDVIYQFSSIETPAVPLRVTRSAPLVIHPETHIAGELRWLIAERRLALRCQPAYVVATVASIMAIRALVQRLAIRQARLVVCISSVFRDHLARDYGVRPGDTVVVPNPVRVQRFGSHAEGLSEPPRILVLGRISVRKGVEDVVAVARILRARRVDAQIRVLGGPSLWSDYTGLLADLPSENAEYGGHIPANEIPAELSRSDILLQASKYEPFGLTVAEALAAGVPVVATSEVGAAEGIDASALTVLAPGDVEGMADAIEATIARLQADRDEIRAKARAEAERLFAPEVVCARISRALEMLVDGVPEGGGHVGEGVAAAAGERPGDRATAA